LLHAHRIESAYKAVVFPKRKLCARKDVSKCLIKTKPIRPIEDAIRPEATSVIRKRPRVTSGIAEKARLMMRVR
jgi:hypothetical protein